MENNLLKLREGWTFRLFRTEWEIIEIGHYHWKMDNSSVEYMIFDGKKYSFLEVEFYKGEFEVVYSEAIPLAEVELLEAIDNKEIIYNGDLFNLEESYNGDYKNVTKSSSSESLESFLFYSKKEDILTIERWNDGSLEVFYGKEISPKKIKKIKELNQL